MNYLTFGKDQYHLHREQQVWCEQHFGQGKWINEPYPKDWTSMPAWTIHSMFGNTTFAFKNSKDFTLFALRWTQ
jgi:hypothetical protein